MVNSPLHTSTARRSVRIAIVAGALSTILGFVVLVGWYSHTTALIQVLPTLVPMQFNTALGFLLCGIGLIALAYGRPRLTLVLAAMVAALSLMTLSEYLFGLQLGVDQLFIKHYITVETSHPGRMAPNTALGFLLTATAFCAATLVKRPDRRYWTVGVLGIAILLLGESAAVGYLTGADSAYGWGNLTRMAAHTSVGFLLLSAGVIAIAHWAKVAWNASPTHFNPDTPARERRLIIAVSVSILTLATLAIGTIITSELYLTGIGVQKNHLVELVRSRAAMIESVARFDVIYSQDFKGGARAATLDQVIEAHQRSAGFGSTGEFALARQEGDQIVFIVRPARASEDFNNRISMESERAEPMRRALKGETGTVIGIDYHSERVLAAYAPVAILDLGIVAKIDLAELRAPFQRSIYLAATMALMIIVIGTWTTVVSINPLVRRVETQARNLHSTNIELTRKISAHEKSVMALRESEDLLQGIYQTYPDLQFIVDPDGTIVRYSAGDPSELYIQPELFLGRRMQDLLPSDVALQWDVALRTASEQEQVVSIEYSLPKLDENRYYEGRISNLPDGRFIAIVRDITERKRSEQQLIASEKKYQDLYNLSPDMFVSADAATGFILECNKTLEQATGYTRDEIIGRPIFDMYHPDSLMAAEKSFQSFITSGEVRNAELQLMKKDGTKIEVSLNVSAVRDKKGKIIQSRSVWHDITKRKQAENVATELGHIVEQSLDELYIFSTDDFRFLLVNRGARNNLGYSTDELLKRTPVDIEPEFTRETFSNLLEPLQSGSKNALRFRTFHRRKNDSQYPVEILLQKYTFQNRPSFVAMVSDITLQKLAEDEIRSLNVGLEQRVTRRTAELKVANHELEAFVYSVSHDLKAPLRAIDAYSGKLGKELEDHLTKEGRRLLDVVRKRTAHMGRLIDDLLAFSRIGRTQLKMTDVDMGTLAQATFDDLAAVHTDRKFLFSLCDLPTVHADYNLVRQIWVNLLENAIKFTGQRKVARIEIGYREEEKQHIFFVRDDGAGFEMEYVDKLFGVFQRLHYEEEFPGTGVGLANVKRIVERHGGDVWAEGRVDHGATFYFRLPASDSFS